MRPHDETLSSFALGEFSLARFSEIFASIDIAITTYSSCRKNNVRRIETGVHFYRPIHLDGSRGGTVNKTQKGLGTQLARILKAIALSPA